MTSAAPAHALLSAAHSLLRAAMHHGRDAPAKTTDKIAPRPFIDKLETNKENDPVTQAPPKAKDIAPRLSIDRLETDKKEKNPITQALSKTIDEIAPRLPIDKFERDKENDPVTQDVSDSYLLLEHDIFTEDVTDMKDVVDAINKLCDTMKSSDYVAEDTMSVEAEVREVRSDYTVDLVSDYSSDQDTYAYSINEDSYKSVFRKCSIPGSHREVGHQFEPVSAEWNEELESSAHILPGEVEQVNSGSEFLPNQVKHVNMASDFLVSQIGQGNVASECLPNQVDMALQLLLSQTEQVNMPSENLPNRKDQVNIPLESVPSEVEQANIGAEVQSQAEEVTSDGEPALNWEGAGSELYYTASSEVSLVSDQDIPEKAIEMDDSVYAAENSPMSASMQEKGDCVVAGHVAAMRERFESLTRSTTPCLDSRTVSPTPTSG